LTITLDTSIRLNGLDAVDPEPLLRQCEDNNLDCSTFEGLANSYRTGRGRLAGRGWLLFTKSQLATIGTDAGLLHTLEVADGSRTVTIVNLGLVRTQAIAANWDAGGSVSTAESVHVVEIADARHWAPQTEIERGYNVRRRDSTFDTPLTGDNNLEPLLTEIWDNHLSLLFGSSLAFEGTLETDKLEGLKFHGMSAWDAFWMVLGVSRLNFRMEFNGDAVVYRPRSADALDKSEFDEAMTPTGQSSRYLIGTEAPEVQPSVPEKIQLIAPLRDYQWWKETNRLTAGDYWEAHPIKTREFTSVDIGAPADRVLSGTTLAVHITTPIVTDDSGSVVGNDITHTSFDHFAENSLDKLVYDRSWTDYRFAGCWSIRPDHVYSGVSWSDVGGGLETHVYSSPGDFDPHLDLFEPSWLQSWEKEHVNVGTPDLSRAHPPRERWGVAVYIGPTPNPLPDGVLGSFDVQSGVFGGSGVSWTSRETVNAVNATGAGISLGTRVLLRWEYQLSTGGYWIAVTQPSQPPAPTQDKLQVVQVQDISGANCEEKNPTATCVWPGRLQTFDISTTSMCTPGWANGANIWIADLNECIKPDTLKQNDRFLAFLVDDAFDGESADIRPLYVIREQTSSDSVTYVELDDSDCDTIAQNPVGMYSGTIFVPQQGSAATDIQHTEGSPVWIVVLGHCDRQQWLRKGSRWRATQVGLGDYDYNGDARPLYVVDAKYESEFRTGTSVDQINPDATGAVTIDDAHISGNVQATNAVASPVFPDASVLMLRANPGHVDDLDYGDDWIIVRHGSASRVRGIAQDNAIGGGTISVFGIEGIDGDKPATTIVVNNPVNAEQIRIGWIVWAEWNRALEDWYVYNVSTDIATIIRGTVAASQIPPGSTGPIDSIVGLDGQVVPLSPLTVSNYHVKTTAQSGDTVFAIFNENTNEWELVEIESGESAEATHPRWGVCQSNWRKGEEQVFCGNVTVIEADDCTGAGINPSGQELLVQLPYHSGMDPNLESGNVISFRRIVNKTTSANEYVCVSDYLDQKIGTMCMHTGTLPIQRQGWAVMDNSDPDASFSMENLFPRGVGGSEFCNGVQVGNTILGEEGGANCLDEEEVKHCHGLDTQEDALHATQGWLDELNQCLQAGPCPDLYDDPANVAELKTFARSSETTGTFAPGCNVPWHVTTVPRHRGVHFIERYDNSGEPT
jgi:hypothetical protein